MRIFVLLTMALLPLSLFAQELRGGICPPFHLYDEQGEIINPVLSPNISQPYSPRQTCGKCHDYEKITQGYHFQQGKDEVAPAFMQERYRWVTSPGNYGGNWCSPAPLYRSLALKKNEKARQIDMTSFEFITATCGYCHPGGGPAELDREGNRYDQHMADPSSSMTPGGDNGLDGDYYKAFWSETGVLEADCMLCHLPEYNQKERQHQIDLWNFRWAATAGARLAKVEGSIKDKKPVTLVYDLSLFDAEGRLSAHLVREPRNETCLTCHAKPQWKKRGANFTSRSDVHMKAGLKCVDCHAAGSAAADPLIRGKEEHQFGKGDDPSGHVRDDLDNTMRDCADCHLDGYLNAPRPKHAWLPPLHLNKIACETCHIPERGFKSAMVQVSDAYNPGPKISPPAKHIWTFYDANLQYWNHYGELAQFSVADKPVVPYRPVLARYKDKIYPVNRVHSAWPGIEEEGKPGLNQPFMRDVFAMWQRHLKDPLQFPLLEKIRDDNGDGMPEVNRDEEIDAMIVSLRGYLQQTGFDLSGKRVVWVNNDLVYYSAGEHRKLAKETFEASPYASVYKYSHDVYPAQAALGVNGCMDCHSTRSGFFTAPVVHYPFADEGKPVYTAQYRLMGLSPWAVYASLWRETWMKPIFYLGMIILFILLLAGLGDKHIRALLPSARLRRIMLPGIALVIALAIGLFYSAAPELSAYMLPSRLQLDANHFYLAVGAILMSMLALLGFPVGAGKFFRLAEFMRFIAWTSMGLSVVCGLAMLCGNGRWWYTFFDLGLVTMVLAAAKGLVLKTWQEE
ncbi:MAG TPA: cytochrome c3 family protein [bacterium]|nr:cytochrome c3 family protein [bacterium]HPN35541.1 cytochrome c3 family protein [bacterium]